MTIRRVPSILSIVVLLSLFSGCAFFNALYNGWSAFNNAEKTERKMLRDGKDSAAIAAATVNDYDRAIAKSEKVVSYYPKAVKHHDDAFYLRGLSYYKKHDYNNAIASFKILVTNYPTSKRVPEGWVYLGKAYMANENYIEAEEAFLHVMENYPKLNKDQEISLLWAELAIKLRGKGQGAQYLEERLAKALKDETRVYIINRLAKLYIELGQHDKALATLDKLPKFHKSYYEDYYGAETQKVEVYRYLKEFQKAEEILAVMAKRNSYLYRYDEISYLQGKVKIDQMLYDEGYEIFEEVTSGTGEEQTRAYSWYEMAEVSIVIRDSLEVGVEELKSAQSLNKDDTLKEKIEKRLQGLEQIFALKKELEDGSDSTDSWLTKYKVGELFWLDATLPDSAISYFDALLADTLAPDSLKAKSLFSKAWVIREIKGDKEVGDSLFHLVIELYPTTEVAKESQKVLEMPVTIVTRRDSAVARFLEAEELRLQHQEYNKDVYYSYLVCGLKYKDIEDVASRAFYAAGIEANRRNTEDGVVDTAAAKIFSRLCSDYPKSEECQLAQIMIGGGKVKGYVSSYEEQIEKASEVQDSLIADSLKSVEEIDEKAPQIPDFESWF